MFKSNNQQKDAFDPETIKGKLVTVYSDKMTKRIAKVFSEKISKNSRKIQTAIWPMKNYEDTLVKIPSTTKILAIGIDLKDEFASDPTVKDVYNNYGVHIRIDGNSCLIYVEDLSKDDYDKMIKELEIKGIKNINSKDEDSFHFNKKEIGIAIGSAAVMYAALPVTAGLFVMKYLKREKNRKTMQYIFAVDIFLSKYLDEFFNEQ